MTFNAKFERLRRNRGLTIRDIAAALELGVGTVGAWAKDARPRPAVAAKLAAYFGLAVDVLLDDEQELPETPPARSAAAVPNLAELREKIPASALALLDQAHLATMHLREMETALELCIKARPTFGDAAAAAEFRAFLRSWATQRDRGRAAMLAAIKALEERSQFEMYRHQLGAAATGGGTENSRVVRVTHPSALVPHSAETGKPLPPGARPARPGAGTSAVA